MAKIGTHNSGTGEKGSGLLSWLVTPFSKCQSKTLVEQYKAGCRYFDIRVKEKGNKLYLAHGLWRSEKTVHQALRDLFRVVDDKVYLMITYEGRGYSDKLLELQEWIKWDYPCAVVTSLNIKKPVWKCIKVLEDIPVVQYFKCLDGSTWHTYLPIPWLWKKIYYNKPKFNMEAYRLVDFL